MSESQSRKPLRMLSKKIVFIVLFCTLLFIACGKKANTGSDKTRLSYSATLTKYAKGFNIERFDSYTRLTVLNPWAENKPFAVYNLYKNDSTRLPSEGIRIKIPLKSVVVNTFAYFEFLFLLGELDKVTGTSDGFRVYNPTILDGLKNGTIADLGDPFKMNVEKTLALKPQAVITSAYAQRDNYSERVFEAGFPVIYNLEWMENSPLARAEWIKMIAVFFDKEELADSIFSGIESRYIDVQKKLENVSQQHTVMAGDNFQDTWYVPGGKSFNAHLFRDARLDYLYKDNTESGSIGLDIETVLTQFGKSEYWFGCTSESYAELAAKDPKYRLLKSVKEKHVFNNNNRTTPSGGNDYFESATANPDLVLKDLIKAAYPELLPDYEFTYIKALK